MNEATLPLVSVLIPVYNQRPEFLKNCIDSVINQTYTNIEIIVSDNHSTNEVREVVNTYRDKRLRILTPPEHLPLTPHFQWASENAKGEYITFLPSDDWFEKEFIEELVKLVHGHQNIVMAFCNVKQYYNGVKNDFTNLKPGVSSSEEEVQAYIKMSKLKGLLIGGMFRRSVYEKIGGLGHGNLSFPSDRWLFIQMAVQGDGAYSNKPYAVFRNDNPLRKSRTYVASVDVVKLFQLIEQTYLTKIRGGQKTLDKEKNKVAYSFLKEMPGSFRSGDLGEEEYRKTLANMKKIGNSRFILSLVRMLENKRLIGLFSAVFYLSNKFNNAVIKIKSKIKRK
jgi:glycosyltransferase involved in cell wall biosynthesis